MNFNKFVPLVKMEEQSDGTLRVFGLVTAEKPDLDNEVCDYAGTKVFYQAKVATMWKLTSAVEGMEPSLMPMREMHQLKAIGAGRTIEFDDANKAIKMGFDVVDPVAILKFKKGVLIGFSQGGAYIGEMVADPTFPGCKRYIADPGEVSGVDSPCLPQALVESMKGRTVTLTKAAGGAVEVPLEIIPLDTARMTKMEREIFELRMLLKASKTKLVDGVQLPAACFAHVGNADDVSTWLVPINVPGDVEKSKAAVQDALAHFEQRTPGLTLAEKRAGRALVLTAAKAAGIEPTEADTHAVSRACAKISLVKGLYEVGWLASLLQDLHWLCLQTEFERDMEDDGSEVPDGLREGWLKLIAEFKAMAIEEADELAAQGGNKGAGSMKIATQADLTKAAKSIADHLDKHMEMHKALHEKMEGTLSKDHPIMKAHQSMMDHCEKCMKAAKDAGAGEAADEDEAEKIAKAAAAAAADPNTAAIAALTKTVEGLAAKLAATPAGVQPHSGVSDGLAKTIPFESLLVTQ